MKKYIAPEVEIKKFNVENIMAESGTPSVDLAIKSSDVANGTAEVSYSELFGLSN